MHAYHIPLSSGNETITDLQLEKIYTSLFDLKRERKKIEEHDVTAVIESLKFCTKNGCLGMGIGWSEENHTIVDIDKSGIEFDHDGIKHRFKEVALLLITKYGTMISP